MNIWSLTPLMLAALTTTGLHAETWRMATPYPDAYFQTVNVREFADAVSKETNGGLTIEISSGGTGVAHGEIPGTIEGGNWQAGEFFLSILSADDPIFGLDSLPFLATDYDQAADLWDIQRPQVQELLASRGLRALYAVPWPPQGLYSRVEITDPAQLEGMAFRTYNQTLDTLATALGAVPVRVEVSDIRAAIARDELDIMLTSASTGVGSQSWEYFPYFYDIQAWLPKNIVVVNAAAFDALPSATQQIVLDAAQNAEDRGTISSMIDAVEAIKIMFDRGVHVLTSDTEVMNTRDGLSLGPVSPALLAGLAKASEIVLAEWAANAGPQGTSLLATLTAEPAQ